MEGHLGAKNSHGPTNDERRMIISIHIPKTAGTTMATVLDHAVGRRILYDYGDLVPSAPAQMAAMRPFLERFSVIHGHFRFSKYGSLFPAADFITCVRHPVERVVSHWFHIQRERSLDNPLYRRVKTEGMDLVDFSSLDEVGAAQSRYLDACDVADLAFVAITERLHLSVRLLRKRFSLPSYHPTLLGRLGFVPTINADPLRFVRPALVRAAARSRIEANVGRDMELYRRCTEKLNDMKRTL